MPVKKKNQNSLLKGATLKGGVRVGPWRHSNYSWRVSYSTGEGSRPEQLTMDQERGGVNRPFSFYQLRFG
jgi:hypothetical protein